jgi:hypothetical protein
MKGIFNPYQIDTGLPSLALRLKKARLRALGQARYYSHISIIKILYMVDKRKYRLYCIV